MSLIITGKLILRPIERDDAPRFAELCNDETLARNTSRIPHPYSLQEAEQFVERSKDEFLSGQETRFAVCLDEELVACTGVMPTAESSFEHGYWVGAAYRGKGIASTAAKAVLQFAFEKLGAKIITAGYFTDNPASGRVLEKLGFRPTGEIIGTMSLARGCEVETARFDLLREKFVVDPDIYIES